MRAVSVCALVAALICAAAAVPAPHHLDTGSNSAQAAPSSEDTRGERNMQLSHSNNEVEIETSAKQAKGEESDAFKFRLQSGDSGFPRLIIRQKVGGVESDFRVQFSRVFSFVPGDIATGYNNESAGFYNVRLDQPAYNAIACSSASGDITSGTLACVFSTADSLFAVKVTVGTAPFVKNNVTVQSTDLKIQVLLNTPDLPANEVVALVIKTRSKSESDSEQSADTASAAIAFGSTAFFTWETYFTDDVADPALHESVVTNNMVDVAPPGQAAPVKNYHGDDDENHADVQEGEMQLLSVFTFAKTGAKSVNWDPVFGQGTLPSTSTSTSSSSLSTGAIIGIAVGASCGLILVVVVVVAALKKRGSVRG